MQIQLMRCWKIALIVISCLTLATTITLHNQHPYLLNQNQTSNFSIKVSQRMRYTLIQYEGQIDVTITADNGDRVNTIEQSLEEGTIEEEYIGSTLSFTLTSRQRISSGMLSINPIQKIEQLRYGEEKFMHIKKGEKRIVEINPSSQASMTIQRFNGRPLFISNLCKNYEKQECLDQMHRFTANQLKKHVEVIYLKKCSNCVLLIQITTNSQSAKMRMSIAANKSNIETYPSLMLLKKDQIQHLVIHSAQLTGKVIIYSGQVELSSQTLHFSKFINGYNYTVRIKPAQGTYHILTIKSVSKVAYIMIQSSLSATQITLIDGQPDTFYLQPNISYKVSYENHNEGKSNIVLNADSNFLQRLRIKFTNNNTKEHYIIRPKFNFHSGSASQNFQLHRREEAIIIQIMLLTGQGGFLNITAEVNEFISLPLDFTYSSILKYQQHDDYIIEGLSGQVEVEIKKCVDCSLKYEISQIPIDKYPKKQLEKLSLAEVHNMKGQQLYIRVFTTNFAFYSIQVKSYKKTNQKKAILHNPAIQFYLTDDQQNNLLLQFDPVLCGNEKCTNVKYYLFEGSDFQHLSSKIYCYSSLFDFDQRTKDVAFEEFSPIKSDGKLSHIRPLQRRDYLGIVADINGEIYAYQVINTEQVKLYKSLRWHFFFLAVFVTAALMASFTLFMFLRKKRYDQSNGYIRTSKVGSMESIA